MQVHQRSLRSASAHPQRYTRQYRYAVQTQRRVMGHGGSDHVSDLAAALLASWHLPRRDRPAVPPTERSRPMKRERITLPIYNLGCGDEAHAIERAIATTPGVTQVYINSLTEMAYVVYDSSLLGRQDLSAVLERLGYGAPHCQAERRPTVATMQPVERRCDEHQTIAQENRKVQTGMIEQLTHPTRSKYTFTIVLV